MWRPDLVRELRVHVTRCVCERAGSVRSNARKGLAAMRATPWRRCVVTAHGKAMAGSRHGVSKTTAGHARRVARAARSDGCLAHAQAPSIPGPRVSVAREELQGQVERLGFGEEQG
jgi:hypothetical protein